MRVAGLWLTVCGLVALCASAGCTPRETVSGAMQAVYPRSVHRAGIQMTVVQSAREGPIIAVFPGAQTPVDGLAYGLRLALDRAMEAGPCSAAIFGVDEAARAHIWIHREGMRRKANEREAETVLVGYGLGGGVACDLTRDLADEGEGLDVVLLVTVDALRRLPAGLRSPVAYSDSPAEIDGGVIRHVNYYQMATAFVHGAAMTGATENHEVSRAWPRAVSHANVDDYVAPLVAADLRWAVDRSAGADSIETSQ